MYVFTNSNSHISCENFNLSSNSTIFYGLTENPLMQEENIVHLCCDDGFELFSCVVTDFARIIYENNTLTLTNEPEPQPIPPTPYEPTIEETLLELTADQEYRLCMIELGLN